MKEEAKGCNVILAGVGGQGILTIAQAISLTAIKHNWYVKQAEVHGMSQRGGEVQSHLRISEALLHSDLIPKGSADLVLAVEPLESLRYRQYLSPSGIILANTVPVVNIPNYPPIEEVLGKIAQFGRHIMVDADRLAKAAGSPRASNIVMLGVAASFLGVDEKDLEGVIAEMFTAKGDRVVEINRRAFYYGRAAAKAYLRALDRGARPRTVRHWLDTVPADQLAKTPTPDPSLLTLHEQDEALSPVEDKAIAQTLENICRADRRQLYEHEVYDLVELVGAISPPQHLFVSQGEKVTAKYLEGFRSDQVVLKLVSQEVVHKTESGAVVFVPKEAKRVNQEMQQLIERHTARGKSVEGVLVVEFVESVGEGFGKELFVGIRATREFGPVIAAGLGGIDTEYLASKMKPGIAVAKALALDTSAEEFFELYKSTAAYEILAGKVRGHQRVVSDGEILRCMRSFIAIARSFCTHREDHIGLLELEVNPFAFVNERMVPLDGRGRLGKVDPAPLLRSESRIHKLLEPKSIAVMGVSAKRINFGRIILNNIRDCDFDQDHLYVIKDQADAIDGVPCVCDIASVPEHVDLLVAATGAESVLQVIDEAISSGRVSTAILIPGGLGEKEGTESTQDQMRQRILAARAAEGGGPVFLGANSMGARSRPGHYDTFFIPAAKFDPRRSAPAKRTALISQSGAFILTRMSNLEFLDPQFAVSIGNQVDLTISDLVQAIGSRDDVDCIGVYAEGFNDLDGLAFVRAVKEVSSAGKVVVFYKAGRTAPGRSATLGHTASLAGDYDVCQAAAAQAGAIVCDTFKEFEQLVELATHLHTKQVKGRRIGAISNAGFESVGMADTILGPRYQVEIPELAAPCGQRLTDTLDKHHLDTLVNARNPLDVTPMASDQAYAECVRVLLEADEIDAVVASVVPMTPQMRTTPDEITDPKSIARVLPGLFQEAQKPLIVVIDSGHPYEDLARTVREGGVPVFRSCDQAIRSLGRYLCARSERQENAAAKPARAETPYQEVGS